MSAYATTGRPSVILVPNRLIGDDRAFTLEACAAARRDAAGACAGEIDVPLSIAVQP
jgi:hypothetical protein